MTQISTGLSSVIMLKWTLLSVLSILLCTPSVFCGNRRVARPKKVLDPGRLTEALVAKLCNAETTTKNPRKPIYKYRPRPWQKCTNTSRRQPRSQNQRQRRDLEMNREKISRMEETIRKLKKDYRRLKKSHKNCFRRTRAMRKKNKKLKRKLEEFELFHCST